VGILPDGKGLINPGSQVTHEVLAGPLVRNGVAQKRIVCPRQGAVTPSGLMPQTDSLMGRTVCFFAWFGLAAGLFPASLPGSEQPGGQPEPIIGAT